MNPHNFSIYTCGICGLLMVAGCIWLLARGVITLTTAAKDGTISVEIADKVKISSTVPAIALFILGLCFIVAALYFSQADAIKPSSSRPLALVGKISGVDNASLVTVTIQPDQYGSAVSFGTSSDGQVNKLLPDIKQLTLTIAANGYAPQPYKTTLNIDDAVDEPQCRLLNLPRDVKFTKITDAAVTVNSPPMPGHIDPTPPGTKLEPLRASTETDPAHVSPSVAAASPSPSLSP
jgi:hypothetical protein